MTVKRERKDKTRQFKAPFVEKRGMKRG